MVEEATTGSRSAAQARQFIDDHLESPEAAARREDKAAMARLMAVGGFIDTRPRS